MSLLDAANVSLAHGPGLSPPRTRQPGPVPSPLQEERTNRIRSQGYCGKGTILGVDSSGTKVIVIPIFCKAWDCPICGPMKRQAWIHRLAAGHPTHAMTLTSYLSRDTDPREQCERAKAAWSRLVERIRKKFGPLDYALVWELTAKGSPHAHILYRGPYIPQKWLSLQWQSLGVGKIVHLKRIKDSRLDVLHSVKYLGKDFGQSATRLAPLRIVQVSKGYELPTDDDAPSEDFAGYSWTRLPNSRGEVLKTLASTDIPFDVEHRHNQSVQLAYRSPVPVVELFKWMPEDFYYSIIVRKSPDTPLPKPKETPRDVARNPTVLSVCRQPALFAIRD